MLDDTLTHIGDYQVLGVLGAGGMGKVYKVRNILTDRIEAMKILLPDLASRRDLADRFLREIKLLAGLNHPNIAALRTALTWNNQLAMIMEYVEGVTLAALVKQGPLSPADAVNYTDQVLTALSYAHGLGIIHRDIKPANMMLTPQRNVKLMDFGIARSQTDPSLTATGATVGSLHYMAPEQMRGEPVDARSDIYSLGVSLYELVTGVRPFQADSDVGVMAAHLTRTPPPPIDLRHDLPAALNSIILMAMAKDPAQRFQTADAFRNALKIASVAPAAPISVPLQTEHTATMTITDTPPISAISAAMAGSKAAGGSPPSAIQNAAATDAAAPILQASSPAELQLEPQTPPPSQVAPSTPSAVMAASPITPDRDSINPEVRSAITPQLNGAALSHAQPPIPPKVSRVPSVLEMSAARPNRTGLYLAVLLLALALIAGGLYYSRHHRSATTVAAAKPATPAANAASAPPDATASTTGANASASNASSPAVALPQGAADKVSAAGAAANSPPHNGGEPRALANESRSDGSALRTSPGRPLHSGLKQRQPHADSRTAGGAPPTSPQQQAALTTPNVRSPAAGQIDQLQHEFDLLSSRADSVNASLDGLTQSQGAQGFGLRADMAASRQRMRRYMDRAQTALANQNAASARRFLDLAEAEVSGLEKFLGR